MNQRSESVIVVGAGIIGLACSHYLREAGYQVTLVDREKVGGACSHGNMGLVCPSHILPLTEPSTLRKGLKSLLRPRAAFRVRPQLRANLYEWLWQFARRCRYPSMIEAGTHLRAILDSSIAEYRRLVVDHPDLAEEWRDEGLLYIFESEAGIDAFAETDEVVSREFGVSARRLDGCALSVMEPALRGGLAGAYYYPADASIRPDTLCQAWSARLRSDGVEIREGHEITGIRRTGSRLEELLTSAGPMSADHYVFATGAWSRGVGALLGAKLPIEPGKGYSMTLAAAAEMPNRPLLLPERHVGITPFRRSVRIGSMMEFVGYDQSIPELRIRQLREAASAVLRTQPNGQEEERWYGWRPMTWDSLPIIGRVPTLDNAVVAAGHNMIGLALAPATGKLVAEILMEREPHIPAAAFSPDRF